MVALTINGLLASHISNSGTVKTAQSSRSNNNETSSKLILSNSERGSMSFTLGALGAQFRLIQAFKSFA